MVIVRLTPCECGRLIVLDMKRHTPSLESILCRAKAHPFIPKPVDGEISRPSHTIPREENGGSFDLRDNATETTFMLL